MNRGHFMGSFMGTTVWVLHHHWPDDITFTYVFTTREKAMAFANLPEHLWSLRPEVGVWSADGYDAELGVSVLILSEKTLDPEG